MIFTKTTVQLLKVMSLKEQDHGDAPVEKNLLGRVVDALGSPIDGKGDLDKKLERKEVDVRHQESFQDNLLTNQCKQDLRL